MKSDNTKRIDQYLTGELSAEETQQFEKELKENEALREEVENQRNLQNAAERAGMRTTVKKVGKRYHRINLSKWIVGGAAIIAIALASIYFATKEDKSEHPTEQTERMEESLDLEQDELITELPREVFSWEGKDTVYLSENGVLISVPDEALLLNGKPFNGKAIIEWQEAMDGATIIKSGLSTMADSNLLETQGMFSFRIQTEDGELLQVDPEVGIYAQVPVDEIKTGMQLYEGVYDKDSIINWVDPKPLEKLPVPVNMSELDFYPQGYEDTLDKLKLSQQKEYRDSLYLACEFEEESNTEKKSFSGRELYEAFCAVCHIPNKESMGPALLNVRDKWQEGSKVEGAIYKWVQNWQEISKVDPYAKEAAKLTVVAHTDHKNLSTKQIDKIFDYIDDGEYPESKISEERLKFVASSIRHTNEERILSSDSVELQSYITPSKVLAFWKDKFNNTILATHEFEKRMRTIHETCNESLLDLYVNNIDQPLYYVDSLAMRRGYSQFERFYAERVGKIDLENPHLKELKKFYERGIKTLQDELKSKREKQRVEEKKWDQKVSDSRNNEQLRSSNRKASALGEEASLNHEHVRKQLGFTQNIKLTSNVVIVNIDREVYAATRARKTTNVSFNGKKSTIRYNDFKLNVAEHDKYERLYVYLLPDKLNSYQRIGHDEGKVDYPLNDRISYDVVILGVNEKGYFNHEIRKTNEGDYGLIKLKSIKEDAFDNRIRELNKYRNANPMKLDDELEWLRLEKKNYKVQRLREEKRLFLERIRKVVFPCYQSNSAVLVESNTPE